MKTKQLLLVAITTLLIVTFGVQRAMAQTLKVHHANGAATDLVLDDQTTVKFNDDHVLVSSSKQSRDFAKSDVLTFTYTILRADVNGDNSVDVADIATVIDVMAGRVDVSPVEADVNGDGAVDVADIASVISTMAELARRASVGETTALPEATNGTIGEAFYIYRNDGQFNAFFRDEIDSIGFSHYDADSLRYNKIISQVVYTPDSTYFMPISVVDSVGFVTPETKYMEDAVPLTGEFFDYLIKADSLTLTFASHTPSAFLPKVGDKLVATDLTDKLPLGFTGLVRQIYQDAEGYEVLCDSLSLEETVTRFYGVVEIVGLQTDGNTRRYLPRKAYSEQTLQFQFAIPAINQKIDLTPLVKPKEVYTINGKAVGNTTINPVITGKITRVVDNILNIDHYNIHAETDVTTVTTVEVVGEAVNSDNPLNLSSPKKSFSIEGTKPGPYGIPIYYAFGPKFDLSGELALGTTVYANFTHTEDITYYPLVGAIGAVVPGLNPVVNRINTVNASTRMTHFDIDWAYIAGKISARLAVVGRLGIGIATDGHSLGWVGGEAQIGAKAEAELGFDFEALSKAENGTGFYDGLKDKAKVVVMPYWGLEGKLSLLDDRIMFTFIGRDDYTFWGKKWEWDFLPKFSDTKAELSGKSRNDIKASANITNDCIIPYTVGFSLFNKNGNRMGDPQWNNQKFWTRNGFSLPYETTFVDLPTDVEYKVYPTLRLFGFNVLASPSADIDMKFPVTLSDFKVTKSQYQKGAFTHDGMAYDYRFDVSVTATLDGDATGIADWGYAYLDPNGREALISLKQFGNTYTDTRYAYFRNENPSTCTLYGYVKYVGVDEPVYGEPHDYPLEHKGETSCPDENHPHMIDLGLPSGTQWACCNVGASTPEGYGNYYAWGEIQPKSVYNWNTYAYWHDNDGDGYVESNEIVNIGSDIAGTGYDAATANWGAPWRMPSLAKCQELRDNCTSVWTSQNGVNGQKFTGPNGGTIFLPAAGRRWDSVLYYASSPGSYWSSTLYESDPYNAWYLNFYSVGVSTDYIDDRCFGLPVRPVR